MTLLFGRLTDDFLNFARVLSDARGGIPGAAEKLPDAAQHFRQSAAKNATYLVYVGGCGSRGLLTSALRVTVLILRQALQCSC